jgi:uncharacterized protein (DUF2225 family)
LTTLLSISLTCPVCGERFDSRAAPTAIVAIGQDTDFRRRYAGPDPLMYQVHACPLCRFCAFEGDFSEVTGQTREFVRSGRLLGAVPSAAVERELSGSTKFLLAAACYEFDNRATTMRLADLHLRGSWCARTEGRPRREAQCQIEAILRFEKTLEDGEVEDSQRDTVLYLLGELYRRVGRFELAVAMFDRALIEVGVDTEESVISLLRRQREAAQMHESENMLMP